MRILPSFALNYFIKRKSRQRIRVLVGHNKLKADGIEGLNKIYENFSNHKFNLFRSARVGANENHKNFYLKLKLLRGIHRMSLNRKIYYYSSFIKKKKSAIIPLPKDYLQIIHKSISLDISYLSSSLRFRLMVLKEIPKSVLLFLRLIKYSWLEKNNIRNNSIYFYDLMPSIFSDDKRETFFNQIFNRHLQHIDKIFMSKDFINLINDHKFKGEVLPTNFPFGSFDKNLTKIFIFIGHFIKDFLVSIIKFFFIGSWQSLYLLPESTKLRYTSLLNKNNIPQELFQSQSDFLSRELWSENFKHIDKKFSIVFYATSLIPLFLKNQSTHTEGYLWNLMNWDRAYLQEQYCINFLKEKNSLVKEFILVEPFSWSNWGTQKISNIDVSHSIVFFDLAPHHFYTALSVGETDWKHSFRAHIKIIEILDNISTDLNLRVIVKMKRKTRYLNKRYSRKLELSKLKVVIDSDPLYLANSSICSLSACFTSTANLDVRKKSAFFDPTNMIIDPYKIARHLDLLNTEEELKNWILFHYKTNETNNYKT